MFRGIVFGDFAGIQEGVWVQLWSGAIGAVPAALIAAGVAVSVLKRSNRKQQELVELQLAEQRRAADRAQKRTILADLLGAAGGMKAAAELSPETLEEQRLRLQMLAYRWEIEGTVPGSVLELAKWSVLLWKPLYVISTKPNIPENLRKDVETYFDELDTEFTSACLKLGIDEGRGSTLGFMSGKRGEYQTRWDALMLSIQEADPRTKPAASPPLTLPPSDL